MVFQILEPDVALTDYGLALLSFILAVLIYRLKTKNHRLKLIITFFYISLALASAIGGTVHGFFPVKDSLGHDILWKLTLISIGVTALLSWIMAGELLWQKYRKIILYLASAEFILYALYVIFINQEFKTAVYNYVPAIVLLLFSLIYIYVKSKKHRLLIGILGISLTFIAAWIQQSKIVLHPVYFNHNALYHLIQIIALLLVFSTFKFILRETKA